MSDRRVEIRNAAWGGLFISPWLVGFVLLVCYPFGAALYWSFCSYDLLTPPEFVGTRHYQRLANELASGEGFGLAIWNTAYYAMVSVPASIALGIGLAIMLSWRVRGRTLFRAVFFLPSLVPVVAASVLWMWLLDAQDGLLNYVLRFPGLPGQLWFQGAQTGVLEGRFGSKDALVLMSLWGIGNYTIIYLAALGDVPRQLYEAAEIDGAGTTRKFWHVTLPMLSPVIFFNLVMGLIQSVQAFSQVYIVSEGTGEPAGATLFLSLHLFLSAFKDLDMGYASAMAWVLFLILLAATAALFRWSKRWVHYQGALR
jgi:multiple sugar transport system permease protein